MYSTRERLNNHDKQFQELPNIYARRDDVREMKREILDAIRNLDDKLDKKE